MMRKRSSNHMAVKRAKVKCMILTVSLTMFMLLQVAFNIDAEAVFTIRPAITLSEEYDDNIYLTRENKVSDFITRVMPSVSMNYGTPFWDWTFDYTLQWWYYAKLGEGRDSHNANLVSRTRLVENFLYLDLNDTYSNVVLDPRQSSTETNLDANRTDQNNLLASLYIKYQISPSVILSTGYRYTNIWYREETAINRQMHTGFATADYTLNPQVTASMSAEYVADRPESPEPNNDQKAIFSKVLYKMNPRMDLDATLGYRWFKFDVGPDGRNVNRPIYGLGLIYRISDTGRIEFRVSSTFSTSPTLGTLESRTEQVTLQYGEALSISGSIFHRRDTYVGTTTEEDETTGFGITSEEDVYGISAALQYKYNPRLTFRCSGRYEKNRFLIEDEERTVFNGSAGIDYQLAPKVTLALTYNHTRENGRTSDQDFTNNVIAVRLQKAF